MTVDEGIDAVDAVEADAVQALAARLFVDDGLRLAAVAPGKYLRGLDARLHLPGVGA